MPKQSENLEQTGYNFSVPPVTGPVLLLDEEKCRNNIRAMANKAKEHRVRLRPHFKTHQSREIGRWFVESGVDKITVSSVDAATYFADAGFVDITIAFPANILERERLNRLAEKLTLNLLVTSADAVAALDSIMKKEVKAFLKIDCGYARAGLKAEDTRSIDEAMDAFSGTSMVKFKGFLAHAGNSYSADSPGRILQIHSKTVSKMRFLGERYFSKWPGAEISIGDTPCCSLAQDFEGVDEIRPGNFVFYDMMQVRLGSCDHRQIAVALACPVVAVNEDRCQAIIHGGAVHLSKEHLLETDGSKFYGAVVLLGKDSFGDPIDGAGVVSLSQEHGVVSLPGEMIGDIAIGDVLGVLPVHACLTSNLMRGYRTLGGVKIDHLSGQSEDHKSLCKVIT